MDMCAQCDAENTMLIVVCCACNNDLMLHLFGSDMSSRNANLRLSVHPSLTCLKLPIFTFLAQTHFKSIQRALSENSEHSKHSESIRLHHTIGAPIGTQDYYSCNFI